jgi:hypothetical protein
MLRLTLAEVVTEGEAVALPAVEFLKVGVTLTELEELVVIEVVALVDGEG